MSRSNLARKASVAAPQRRDEENLRLAKVKIKPVPEEERKQRMRAQEIRKSTKRSGIKLFGGVLGIVLILTTMFGFILGQQTKLVELNFENAKIEREITKLEVLQTQRNRELEELFDKHDVRMRALELGMQDPIQSQIVYLNVPVQDRLILGQVSSLKAGLEDEQGASAKANIEGFFKSFLP